MVGFDPKEGRPKMAAWMERVRSGLSPHYDDGHVIVNKVIAKYGAKYAAKL